MADLFNWKPIEGADELLKVVSSSKLWTERLKVIEAFGKRMDDVDARLKKSRQLDNELATASAATARAERTLQEAKQQADAKVKEAKETAEDLLKEARALNEKAKADRDALESQRRELAAAALDQQKHERAVKAREDAVAKREAAVNVAASAAEKLPIQYEEKIRKRIGVSKAIFERAAK